MTKTKNLTSKKSKNNKKRSGWFKALLFTPSKIGRVRLVAFVLIFAAVGAALLYFSLAAGFNSNDEKTQYAGIDNARIVRGLYYLPASTCLNTVARNWSQHLAEIHPTQAEQYHDATYETAQIKKLCNNLNGGFLRYWSENVAAGSNCSSCLFDGLMNSPGHKDNILNTQANYSGVGVYTDSSGQLWVTHEFIGCDNCSLTTYKPVTWGLVGTATVGSATAARASSISVSRGQTFTYYHNVKNLGPDTATYHLHVIAWHYSPSGALLFTNTMNNTTATTGMDRVYSWALNATVPTTAQIGEKYCHAIYYEYATGPGSGSGQSFKACATVK